MIKIVEEVAQRQKMKSLKITGRNRTHILPAKWIAGVDHDIDNNNPDKNNGDHNKWVDQADTNEAEDEDLPEAETNPVTDDEIRQLWEDEAQQTLDANHENHKIDEETDQNDNQSESNPVNKETTATDQQGRQSNL